MMENSNPGKNKNLTKSFEDLILEVHNRGICGECGGCVSFCSAAKFNAIQMTDDGPPRYSNKDNCLSCGLCYLICPQTKDLDSQLYEKYQYKPPIGNWRNVTSAQAKDPEIRAVATDGGVVTALLSYLLDKKMINGALVTKRTDPFSREPFLARTREELIDAAGSRFDSKAIMEHLGKYTTFTPIVTGLKQLIDTDRMKIAVVGVPCQIHSIRKMQALGILPAHVIKYVFGLFCYENFTFTEEIRQKMEEEFNFTFNDVVKMNIKEDLIFRLRNAEPLHIPFLEIKKYMRPACTACNDFSNVYADISFGGLGSIDGFTTALIRTPLGTEIYNKTVLKGDIFEAKEASTRSIKSQMIAKIISFAQRKIGRAEKTLAKFEEKVSV